MTRKIIKICAVMILVFGVFLSDAEEGLRSQAPFALAEENECGKGFATSFLPSVTDFQDFSVYWTDIFTKNMCQIEDIFSVEDDLDSIAASLRNSYYSCDYDNILVLTKEYKAKKAELYFVRNAAAVDSEALNSTEVDEAESAMDLYINGFLYEEMVEKYVTGKGWFEEGEFKSYFDSWVSEYEDNIKTYIDCDYGDWSEVAEKWEELMNTFERTEVEPQEGESLSAKDAPAKDNEGFFAKHFDFKASGIDKISKDIKSALESMESDDDGEEEEEIDTYYSDGGIVSTSDSYANLLAQYDTEMTEVELLAKYKTLYGEGGTEIAYSLTALIADLNESLKNTAKSISTIINKAAKKISKKQCNG